MCERGFIFLLAFGFFLSGSFALAENATNSEKSFLHCLLCDSENKETIQQSDSGVFNLQPYNLNYIIAQGGTVDSIYSQEFDLKFQISLKQEILNKKWIFESLCLFYTQKSYWNISYSSSPFRESNYNPGVFGILRNEYTGKLGNWKFHLGSFGYEHESNGRGDERNNGEIKSYSRSWDRVYYEPQINYLEYIIVKIRGWGIINRDYINNRDIREYLGNGELIIILQGPEKYQVQGKIRQGKYNTEGTFQLDVILNIRKNFDIYVQYFHGYGESLIDYDRRVNRFGLGLAFYNIGLP